MDSKINFSHYLMSNERKYVFTIKVATNDLTENQKDCIERALMKYDLHETSDFSETPIQSHPLDFPNVKNSKVFSFHATVGYPITPDALRRYISEKLGMSEQMLMVYPSNDPRHQYTEDLAYRTSKEFKEEYETAIGTDVGESEEAPTTEEQVDNVLDSHKEKRENEEVKYYYNKLSMPREKDESSHAGYEESKQGTDSPLSNETRKPMSDYVYKR